MRFEILTLFPETFQGFIHSSLIGKAVASGLLEIHIHNIRDFAPNRRQADDKPYGGGPGMVMMAEPIYLALQNIKKTCLKGKKSKVSSFILSPRGAALTPTVAHKLSKQQTLILLAGHYEGVDARILPYFDGELCTGPYVTMGGEVPAMAVMEAVSRFVPGVIGDPESLEHESFSIQKGGKKGKAYLEWPQYTRPGVWRKKKVPPVLLSGHHEEIKKWRLSQAKISKGVL